MPKPISEPELGQYKANKTLSLPNGKEGYPFSFGLTKAKTILDNIEVIKAFVASNGESLD